jgi:hypothetical protein
MLSSSCACAQRTTVAIRNPTIRGEAGDTLHLVRGAAIDTPAHEPALTLWRFLAVVLTALLLGTTFAHVLEMPVKLQIDAVFWMTLQHTLYREFGSVGAMVEVGAIASVLVLSVLLRQHGRALWLTLLAAACLLVAFFVVWLVFTSAVNAETARWTADSIPTDWMHWRTRWEFSHALRFALHLLAFCSLVVSLLVDLAAAAGGDAAPA